MKAVAVSAGTADAGSPKTVIIKDFDVTPATVTIRKGQSVTWTFRDTTKHDVVLAKFMSPRIRTGTYKCVFRKAGRFSYVCSIHPGMRGKVVVR